MEKKKIIIPVAVVVLLIIVISIISVVRKNMPSKKHMDLKDYFNVQDATRYSLFYRMNQVVHQVYMKMVRFTLTWVQ